MWDNEGWQLIQAPRAAEQEEETASFIRMQPVFKVRHQEELTDGKDLFSSEDTSTIAWGILNNGTESTRLVYLETREWGRKELRLSPLQLTRLSSKHSNWGELVSVCLARFETRSTTY